MDVEEAIRTRRTHKVYGREPVPRETLDELFELARWAPNHNLTNPWRFRVVGPESLAASITFLLSDDGHNVNGVILPSDGGWSAV